MIVKLTRQGNNSQFKNCTHKWRPMVFSKLTARELGLLGNKLSNLSSCLANVLKSIKLLHKSLFYPLNARIYYNEEREKQIY